MIYSFDVFDTVITRKTARPDGIFAYMQEVIVKDDAFSDLPQYLRDNFYDIRKDTQRFVGELFRTNGIQEITTDDIYGKIKSLWSLSEYVTNRLIELEYAIELENIIPIDRTIKKILDLKSRNETVIFVSDMYMPKKQVEKMIVAAEPKLQGIPLYVSSEYRKTKVTGDLYRIVGDIYHIDYKDWMHEGDNPYSDFEVPDTMGINVIESRNKKLLPIEDYVCDLHKRDYLSQIVIGVGVNARFLRDDDYTIGFCYGTALLLPLLASYSSWILSQCIIRKITNLVFIARDGYLLKYTVDTMAKARGLNIQTSYIYGSREAWRIPALSEEYWNVDILGARSRGTKDLRIDDFAAVFGMDYEELYDFMPGKYKNRKILQRDEKIDLATVLQNDTKFKRYLIEKNVSNRELAQRYLTQEINNKEDRFAFVEFIGGGNTQTALAELLMDGKNPITTFYFSTTGEFSNDKCIFHQCYPVSFSFVWQYEMFLVAPHGRTVGYYENDDSTISPKLNNEHKALLDYGMGDFIEGYYTALDNMDMSLDAPLYLGLDYADYMWKRSRGRLCDKDLEIFYGNMPYGVSGREKDGEIPRYGGKLSREEIYRLYAIRTYEDVRLFYDGCNYAISQEQMEKEDYEYAKECRDKMFDDDVKEQRRAFWKKNGTNDDRLIMLGIPIDKIGKKVAVYGAGKFGRVLIEALDDFSDVEVVLWVDKKWKNVEVNGRIIRPIEDVFTTNFDQIIIGIIKDELVSEVEEYLVERGIDNSRIVKIHIDK